MDSVRARCQCKSKSPVHGGRWQAVREPEGESLHQIREHQEELHLSQLLAHAQPAAWKQKMRQHQCDPVW
ncbi:hypothetical protein ANANG_G00097980, partial [Anguilla anguilla]